MITKSQEKTLNKIDKIFAIFKGSLAGIRPHIILTGPSGAGKSRSINVLCQKYNLQYMEVNAAAITKEGTSGASITKVLNPLLNMPKRPTVVFVDEFDKLFISGNSNSSLAHETTNGVQNEFLKVLEAETIDVYEDFGHYKPIDASKLLFIFAGTFNGEPNISVDRLREFGIKTEFIGRIAYVFNLTKLTVDDLHGIVTDSPLIDSYMEIFPEADKDKCIKQINKHIENIYDKNTIGARVVNNLVHKYFIDGSLNEENITQGTFQE